MSKFTIRGTRGTMAEAGPHVVKYGGNTTCFSLETEAGLILVDAGTGLHHVNRELNDAVDLPPIVFLFTHFHLDHIIGLPIFTPLYRPGADLVFVSDPNREYDAEEEMVAFMRRPYWPVPFADCVATRTFKPLPPPDRPLNILGVDIAWTEIPHPQKSVAFRLEAEDQTVVVATDTEYASVEEAGAVIELARGADYLLFDGHYLPEEFDQHRGYGHSTWETAVDVARAAGVKWLVMTHHAPGRTDDQIDAIIAEAQAVFPHTVGARENMVLGSNGPEVEEAAAPSAKRLGQEASD